MNSNKTTGMFTVKNFKEDCVNTVLFDDDYTRQRRKFVKTIFQDIAKSENITEHQLTEYHKRNAEKAKHFITVFEDPTKAVSYDKNENEKYEYNLYILKVVIQAVLLCSEQGLLLRGHRDYGEFDVTIEKGTDEKTLRGNFHAVLNSLAMLDPTFTNHLKHGSKNSKMMSWKIQNEVIECLATFARSNIKAEMPDYFAVIADEVTDRFSNSEVLLLCLRNVTFHNEKPKICETFFDSLHVQGRPSGQTTGNSI